MTFSISAQVSSWDTVEGWRADLGRGMIAGMIWKGHVLIFLSYTSDKLFYETNKQINKMK